HGYDPVADGATGWCTSDRHPARRGRRAMILPTTLREDSEKMACFIVNNYPDAKEWHDPVAKAAWYISHAFVACVLGDEEEIVAICAARPVERPGLGVLPSYF